jgi:hypothetical protein
MEPLKVRDANVFSPSSRGQSQEQVIAGLLLIKGGSSERDAITRIGMT